MVRIEGEQVGLVGTALILQVIPNREGDKSKLEHEQLQKL